jgi:hypothetical protein
MTWKTQPSKGVFSISVMCCRRNDVSGSSQPNSINRLAGGFDSLFSPACPGRFVSGKTAQRKKARTDPLTIHLPFVRDEPMKKDGEKSRASTILASPFRAQNW